jgi:hypothetical protein
MSRSPLLTVMVKACCAKVGTGFATNNMRSKNEFECSVNRMNAVLALAPNFQP